MGLLSGAPQGFSSAVSSLNSIPQSVLAEMCQDAVAFLRYQPGFISDYEPILSKLDVEPKPNARACISALVFLFRSAALEGLSADMLSQELKSTMEWGESAIAVVKHVWKEEGAALLAMPKETLSVGQLQSVEWKLGVSMSSSSCRTLNSPHVSLQLRVAESDGTSKLHTVDMTVPEFQGLAGQLKEMSATLDTAA